MYITVTHLGLPVHGKVTRNPLFLPSWHRASCHSEKSPLMLWSFPSFLVDVLLALSQFGLVPRATLSIGCTMSLHPPPFDPTPPLNPAPLDLPDPQLVRIVWVSSPLFQIISIAFRALLLFFFPLTFRSFTSP